MTNTSDIRVLRLNQQGPSGSPIYFGTSAPDNTTPGANGAVFINQTNGNLYQKISNAWVFQLTIKGTNGINGIDGTNAINGTNGVDSNPTIDLILLATNGGEVLLTGSFGTFSVDFDCTIEAVTLIADQVGNAICDIKKSDYTTFPTTTSICASAKPTIASAQKNKDTALTGWTKIINAGDILEFSLESVSTITQLSLTLKVTKT